MAKKYSVQLIKDVAIEIIAGANVMLESGETLEAPTILIALHKLLTRSPEYCQHFEQTWEQAIGGYDEK